MQDKTTTIFLIGDSTAANKDISNGRQERGWGMALQDCFESPILIDNHAVNGRSSKSFIDEGRWDRVLEKMRPGDYVVIQFGHNDEKPEADRHTEPGSTFDANLARFVRETREHGGIPVLMNSVVRRNFAKVVPRDHDDEALRNTTYANRAHVVESDTLVDTHGPYRIVPREVAQRMNVHFIDANRITHDLEQGLGVEGSKKLHMWFRPGEEPSVPEGRQDNTHYNIYGARVVANLLADALCEEIPVLRKYRRKMDADNDLSCPGGTLGIQTQPRDSLTMLVGTYTDGTSCGIYSYRFNQLTGETLELDSLPMPNPSYLTVLPDPYSSYAKSSHGGYYRTVYAVSETNDTEASLNSILLDESNGRMQLTRTMVTGGADPCYVSTNGQLALTANYSGGSMSVFCLEDDGSLRAPAILFEGAVGGPDLRRQAEPHIHCATFTPDGGYILATDFSADRILSYRLKDGQVVDNGVAAAVTPDSGPRHLVFSKDGRFAYLMNELSGRVTVFGYREGRLRELQSIASDTVGARGGADIHLSPDGRHLYSSNRLKADGIAVFSVDSVTGKLTKVGYQPTASHPRQFSLTPNGRFLLCACRDGQGIQVYRRDAATGLLSDTGQDIRVSKAVCVRFCE